MCIWFFSKCCCWCISDTLKESIHLKWCAIPKSMNFRYVFKNLEGEKMSRRILNLFRGFPFFSPIHNFKRIEKLYLISERHVTFERLAYWIEFWGFISSEKCHHFDFMGNIILYPKIFGNPLHWNMEAILPNVANNGKSVVFKWI